MKKANIVIELYEGGKRHLKRLKDYMEMVFRFACFVQVENTESCGEKCRG